jgi:hypothetical protein
VAKVAQEILSGLEAIRSMSTSDDEKLPTDVVYGTIGALRYNESQKLEILPLITSSEGVTLAALRDLVKTRFESYELLSRTLNQKAVKSQDLAPPVLGGAGQTDGTAPGKRNRAKKNKEANEKKQPLQGKKPFSCKYCKLKNKNDQHKIFDCKEINATARLSLINMKFCVGCLAFKKPDQEHKCHILTANGKPKVVFCVPCKANMKICTEPSSTAHQPTTIPESFCGFGGSGEPVAANPCLHSSLLASILSSAKAKAQKVFQYIIPKYKMIAWNSYIITHFF